MNPSLPTNDNPYAPPDVNDGATSVPLNTWRSSLSFLAFFVGSMIGLNVGSGISEGLAATMQKSADNIPGAVWAFLSWAGCCVAFTCPWRICRRVLVATVRPAPLACFVAAILVASLFYVAAQQVGRSGVLNVVPMWTHSSVFALMALVFGSCAVECEIVLTRLFSRSTRNGVDHANKDSIIAPN